MNARVLALAVALAVASCAPARTQLIEPPPPSPTAPLAERRAYYEARRPIVVRASRPGALWSNDQAPSYMLLADGSRVDQPDDLVTSVAPDSTVALAGARARDDEGAALSLAIAGTAMFGAGAAASLATLLSISAIDAGVFPRGNAGACALLGFEGVGLALASAGAASLLLAAGLAGRAAKARDAAFADYPAALRAKLGLTEEDVAGLSGTWAPAENASGDVVLAAPGAP